jgi:hypothetical protein
MTVANQVPPNEKGESMKHHGKLHIVWMNSNDKTESPIYDVSFAPYEGRLPVTESHRVSGTEQLEAHLKELRFDQRLIQRALGDVHDVQLKFAHTTEVVLSDEEVSRFWPKQAELMGIK